MNSDCSFQSSHSSFCASDLPDGVDPSFLAALPDSIRQEVISEQLRLQRIQQRAQEQQQQAELLGASEVNADFLAALPPAIQEEVGSCSTCFKHIKGQVIMLSVMTLQVLAQQRHEHARLNAEASGPPQAEDSTVDPASFIQSLPPSLRQQVCAWPLSSLTSL